MKAITLLYHDVVPRGGFDNSGFRTPDANIYKLECEEFRRHLESIARNARQAPARVMEPASSEAPLFLTFDDGGESAHRHIVGMLAEFGWPAHFFITTDMIGRPGFLSSAQIQDLRSLGHVIGSHSCSHPLRMSACAPAQLHDEWRRSTSVLAEILGEPVTTASIPGGYYSQAVAHAAAEAGVHFLFTSEPVIRCRTIAGCMILGRFGIQQGVPPAWTGRVVAGDRSVRLQRYLFWNLKKLLKRIGGDYWLHIRRTILARRSQGAL